MDVLVLKSRRDEMFIEPEHPHQLEAAEQRNSPWLLENIALLRSSNIFSDSSAINIWSLRDLRNNRRTDGAIYYVNFRVSTLA